MEKKKISKEMCCGCSACMQICPKHCITMEFDNEGFLYPNFDARTCVSCGLCETVCHERYPYEKREPLSVYASFNKDDKIRFQSSSGGLFTALASTIIDSGGVVFGARFDDEWQVYIDYTKTKDGLSDFRGSKYVQARIGYAYKQVEFFLKRGKLVLFSGTPCQIAGLRHFLNKNYQNLFTVDFVCHGTPSPFVWKRYLCEFICNFTSKLFLSKKAIKINNINFRNKKNGWKNYCLSIDYERGINKNSYDIPYVKDKYMKAFLSNMILRPSCYNCKAKDGRSGSDITIGDYWGVMNYHPEMDDDKGTSIIIINSSKGQYLYSLQNVKDVVSDFSWAKKRNPGLRSVAKKHKNRERFFNELNNSKSVVDLISNMLEPTLFHYIMKKIILYIKKIPKMILR